MEHSVTDERYKSGSITQEICFLQELGNSREEKSLLAKSRRWFSGLMVLVFWCCVQPSFSQSDEFNSPKRWGIETSPIAVGVFNLYQGKATYLINSTSKLPGEVGFGFLIQPESHGKANEAYNKDGMYSALMASLAYRQYFWKGLHLEFIGNFGQAKSRENKIDQKDYTAFVIFTQTLVGYKFNVIKTNKVNVFLIGQGGFGYVPLNTNQWPRADNTAIYGLGDLKLGVNF